MATTAAPDPVASTTIFSLTNLTVYTRWPLTTFAPAPTTFWENTNHIAYVVVGAVFGVILLIGLIVLCVYCLNCIWGRNRKRSKYPGQQEDSDTDSIIDTREATMKRFRLTPWERVAYPEETTAGTSMHLPRGTKVPIPAPIFDVIKPAPYVPPRVVAGLGPTPRVIRHDNRSQVRPAPYNEPVAIPPPPPASVRRSVVQSPNPQPIQVIATPTPTRVSPPGTIVHHHHGPVTHNPVPVVDDPEPRRIVVATPAPDANNYRRINTSAPSDVQIAPSRNESPFSLQFETPRGANNADYSKSTKSNNDPYRAWWES